jgi:hypothetical protein
LDQNFSLNKLERGYVEALISALSVGSVLILIGVVFVINQNLWGNIVDFFKNISTIRVTETSIFLPAPTVPSAPAGLYTAVEQFDLGVGILQVVILAARFFVQSRIRRIAETIGNLVFWFGASYLTETYLNFSTTQEMWFLFWAAIIVLFGVSLIVRAIVLFARKSHQIKNRGKSYQGVRTKRKLFASRLPPQLQNLENRKKVDWVKSSEVMRA